MNTICLVVDRLHCGYLGPYGNCWIETPAFDRLASQGFVFDQCLVDSPALESLYRSCWQGRHAIQPQVPSENQPLALALAERGVNSLLVTDEAAVAEHPLAAGFADVRRLLLPDTPQTAATIEKTYLAQCFAFLIDQVESLREPFFVWCHLTGLGSPWDAPLDYRLRYIEPGDPQPSDSIEVPSRMLESGFDPDQALAVAHAYAGQVSLLDTCLAALVEFLDSAQAGKETLLVATSARGMPLGEHRRIGPCDEALYSELVQVPLLVRFPDQSHAACRSQGLVEPADLWATILDWHGVPLPNHRLGAKSLLPLMREEVDSVRDRLYVAGPGQRAIRTPAWYLRETILSESSQIEAVDPNARGDAELFVKPDDRWEVNEVSARADTVAELLRDAMGNYEQVARGVPGSELCALDDILLSGME